MLTADTVDHSTYMSYKYPGDNRFGIESLPNQQLQVILRTSRGNGRVPVLLIFQLHALPDLLYVVASPAGVAALMLLGCSAADAR